MIEIQNLTKRYGAVEAVSGISFTVDKGEIVGLLGANGAGKSTTMNMMTGYISATEGTVTVDGIGLLDDPDEVKRRIGYLPEIPPLYPDMTVGEYLNFAYDLKKCTLDRKKHLEEICEVTHISDVRRRLIRNLSKGYKQRIGLAQALIGNPPLIILDEPTVGLDPQQIIEIRNLIRVLGRDHAVILSTHILSEVQAVCDRVIVLDRGKIMADEKTADLARSVQTAQRLTVKVAGPRNEILNAIRSMTGVTYVQVLPEHEADSNSFFVECEAGIDLRKSLFRRMAQSDWPIVGLESTGVNLEDAFLSLIRGAGQKEKKRRVRVRVSNAGQNKED